jgi:hypothetical protein
MGEIPDWLIELAENADNEDNQDSEATEQITEELSETVISPQAEVIPETRSSPPPQSGFLEEPVTLMNELRSQVEPFGEEVDDKPTPLKPRKSVTFAGMVPWQLAVLTVLLFLDITIIGLLFLTILGRISIP